MSGCAQPGEVQVAECDQEGNHAHAGKQGRGEPEVVHDNRNQGKGRTIDPFGAVGTQQGNQPLAGNIPKQSEQGKHDQRDAYPVDGFVEGILVAFPVGGQQYIDFSHGDDWVEKNNQL